MEYEPNEIISELEQAWDKPLDYVHFVIFDHGVQNEPFETWVDADGQDCDELDDEEADELPPAIQDMADILLDLKDEYKVTHLEYKVEQNDDEPVFFVQVFAVPCDDGEESNITDDVMNAFYRLFL